MFWIYSSKRETSGTHQQWITLAVVLCALSTLVQTGCSGTGHLTNEIAVEGVVTVRGAVPFNAPILETQARNFYVLVLTGEQKARLITPGRFRAAGRVYLDTWNGRPFAHLEAHTLVSLDPP